MPKDYFDEPMAARYDQIYADLFEPAVVDPAVDFLAELAGQGAALELGIGTGRLALPLVQRGSTYMASTCRKQWSPGCAASRARSGSG